jgi:hypothetical protein
MSTDKIVCHLHPTSSQPPPIQLCDAPNALEKKSHWTSEELHRITGCHQFCNYKHRVSVTKDGSFIDSGKTSSFSVKAPHGAPTDCTSYKYLDVVHIDIAFGNCASVGGFKCALIFVDRAMRYNWWFGLKSLQFNNILVAFKAFWLEAGSLACQFWCDCDDKFFGSNVHIFLHIDILSILASPAGCQSSNGLVESHWKIMVHILWAYLTQKQMPRSF